MKKNSLRASVNTRPSKKLVAPPLPIGKAKDENNNAKSMGEPLVVKTIFGGAPSTSKGAGIDLHRTIGGRVTKRRATSGAKLVKPSTSRPAGATGVRATRSKTRLAVGKGLWPSKDLFFKTFPKDEAYTYLHEILKERGWKYAGNPYKGTEPSALKKIVKQQDKLPRRCMWLVEENEAHYLAELKENGLEEDGGRYRIGCFLGSEAANYKTNLTMKLNKFSFYPDSYAMPKEMERFNNDMSKNKKPMWIYKPKNDYGGSGCHVYNISMPQFDEVLKRDTQKRRNFVLQRYIENPLLVGGYKFHMRIFLLLTSMNPPCGYLHLGGQVLFSTKKYSYDHSTLGANFDKYAHLTNWSIHSLPNNYDRLLAKKDVIGVGCEWRFKRLIRHLKKEHPSFKESDMWNQLSHIGRETLKAIMSHDTCKRYAKKMVPGRHFEVYGMDILMDDKFKLWLLECNNSPGLCDSPEKLKVGNKTRVDFGAREARKDTREAIHDIFAMLGLDAYDKCGSKDNFIKLL